MAAKLVFTAQPGGAAAGVPFTTQPAVAAEDPSGNAVNGVASFSDLRIDVSGTYTLRASSGSLVTAQSGVFDVSP